jgi:hypothetical protein
MRRWADYPIGKTRITRLGEPRIADTTWVDARRPEAWAGELRVNLIRAVALVVFYASHLLNVYVWTDDPEARGAFHAVVTAAVLAWTVAILLLNVFLTRRFVSPALKYLSTAVDLVLITALVMVSPEGPRSPLMLLYFVVIAAAPLRLSLPLVYATTLGAMAAALFALGHYVLVRLGWQEYMDPSKGHRIPRVTELLFLLALGASGLLAGQLVRQARRLVHGYPVKVQDHQEAV